MQEVKVQSVTDMGTCDITAPPLLPSSDEQSVKRAEEMETTTSEGGLTSVLNSKTAPLPESRQMFVKFVVAVVSVGRGEMLREEFVREVIKRSEEEVRWKSANVTPVSVSVPPLTEMSVPSMVATLTNETAKNSAAPLLERERY